MRCAGKFTIPIVDATHNSDQPQIAQHDQNLSDSERWGQFSGPVLRDEDRRFAGFDDSGRVSIQIPEAYWRVVVANDVGTLKLFAFVLRQELGASRSNSMSPLSGNATK